MRSWPTLEGTYLLSTATRDMKVFGQKQMSPWAPLPADGTGIRFKSSKLYVQTQNDRSTYDLRW
jgi:hypothetical protein